MSCTPVPPVSRRLRQLGWPVAILVVLALASLAPLAVRSHPGSAAREIPAGMVVRRYDVKDLLKSDFRDFEGPDLNHLNATSPPSPQPGQGSGARAGIAPLVLERCEWRRPGCITADGAEAVVEGSNLVVTASPGGQALVEQALADIRANRGCTIALSTRLLSLNGAIQPAGEESDPDAASLNRLIDRSVGCAAGRHTSAILTDAQAQKLCRWCQRQPSTTTLTAPRVNLFDSQRAYVQVATSRAYVSGFGTRLMPDGSRGPEPATSTVTSGMLLDLQPLLAGDRSSMLLRARPEFANILAMSSKDIPNPLGPERLTIQVPILSQFKLNECREIPLGKVLAIGGRMEVLSIEDGKAAPLNDPAYPANPVLLLVTPTLHEH